MLAIAFVSAASIKCKKVGFGEEAIGKFENYHLGGDSLVNCSVIQFVTNQDIIAKPIFRQ